MRYKVREGLWLDLWLLTSQVERKLCNFPDIQRRKSWRLLTLIRIQFELADAGRELDPSILSSCLRRSARAAVPPLVLLEGPWY